MLLSTSSALRTLIIVRVIQKARSDARRGRRRGPDLLKLTFNLAKIRLLSPRKIVQIPLHLLLRHDERLVRTR